MILSSCSLCATVDWSVYIMLCIGRQIVLLMMHVKYWYLLLLSFSERLSPRCSNVQWFILAKKIVPVSELLILWIIWISFLLSANLLPKGFLTNSEVFCKSEDQEKTWADVADHLNVQPRFVTQYKFVCRFRVTISITRIFVPSPFECQ